MIVHRQVIWLWYGEWTALSNFFLNAAKTVLPLAAWPKHSYFCSARVRLSSGQSRLDSFEKGNQNHSTAMYEDWCSCRGICVHGFTIRHRNLWNVVISVVSGDQWCPSLGNKQWQWYLCEVVQYSVSSSIPTSWIFKDCNPYSWMILHWKVSCLLCSYTIAGLSPKNNIHAWRLPEMASIYWLWCAIIAHRPFSKDSYKHAMYLRTYGLIFFVPEKCASSDGFRCWIRRGRLIMVAFMWATARECRQQTLRCRARELLVATGWRVRALVLSD